jgi:hypothetical protein
MCAILVWVAVIVQIGFYDLETALINHVLPNNAWPLTSKFFVSTVVICAFLFGIRYQLVRKSLTFVLFYPLRFAFFRVLPRMVVYWPFTFLIFPSIVSFVRAFRMRITMALLGFCGWVMLFWGQRPPQIASGMLLIVLFLVGNYVRHFRMAFSMNGPLYGTDRVSAAVWRFLKGAVIDKHLTDAKESNIDTVESDKKRKEALENCLLLRGLVQLLISKLSAFAKSGRIELYLLVSLAYSIVLTIVLFGFEYYGLHKIHPDAFTATNSVGLVHWLYFSLMTLLHVSIGGIQPSSSAATFLVAAESICGVVLMLFLFFIITSVLRPRYHSDFTGLIDQLKQESNVIELKINSEFGISLKEAEEASAARPLLRLLQFSNES